MEKLKTSPAKDPPRTGFLRSSGAVQRSSKRQTGQYALIPCSYCLVVVAIVANSTLWVFGKCEVLSVEDHREAVVRDLQNKATVDQTVVGLQTAMTQTSQVKILHSLKHTETFVIEPHLRKQKQTLHILSNRNHGLNQVQKRLRQDFYSKVGTRTVPAMH